MRDIAKAAGLHVTSVSMALRNHPRISKSTRARVLRIAREMNYSPDPALTALIAYRDQKRKPTFHGKIAWLIGSDREGHPTSPMSSLYRAGASERARELGYELEDIHCDLTPRACKAFTRIVHTRGIAGVCVCPFDHDQAVDLAIDWKGLSVVTFGYSVRSPELHRVCFNYFRSGHHALEEMHRLGYGKIGLCLRLTSNVVVSNYWEAAYHLFTNQRNYPAFPSLLLKPNENHPAAFKSWFKRHRPDAVLDQTGQAVHWLGELGIRVPQDVGIARTLLPPDPSDHSGIDQVLNATGRIAIEQLARMIRQNETGIPDHPTETLVHGFWRHGVTTSKRSA